MVSEQAPNHRVLSGSRVPRRLTRETSLRIPAQVLEGFRRLLSAVYREDIDKIFDAIRSFSPVLFLDFHLFILGLERGGHPEAANRQFGLLVVLFGQFEPLSVHAIKARFICYGSSSLVLQQLVSITSHENHGRLGWHVHHLSQPAFREHGSACLHHAEVPRDDVHIRPSNVRQAPRVRESVRATHAGVAHAKAEARLLERLRKALLED
mmetsp:Transcript_21558/g.38233  ORF Transcript_21558/g.38233 Transcript_21558/m.38233 type:complete len:209 (-) Transcript_21558:767-1393(-)